MKPDGPTLEPPAAGAGARASRLASWARVTFAAFGRRDYRLFWIGNAVCNVGTWARTAAQSWLVWDLTRDERWLAGVGAASLLPIAIVSLPAGALADRFDKRRLLLGLQVGMMAVSSVLAVLVAMGLASAPLLVAFAAVLAVLRGAEMPCRQAFVVELVGRETLRNAVALNSIMFNLPLVLGPALAGEILAAWGPSPVFVVDALSYAAPVAAFALIRARPTASPRPAQGPLAQVMAGVRFVASSPPARALLALLSAAMLFGWSYTSLLPAYADDLLGGDASVYGRLYSTSGLGATLGALWIAGRHGGSPGRRIAVLLACFSASLLAMALWPSVPLAFAARTVAGFSMVSFFATANTTLQLSIPDGIRGRVMALWTFTFSLSLPVGQMILGQLARSTSVATAFAAGACAVLAVSLAVSAGRPFRREEAEGPGDHAAGGAGLSGPA